MRSRRDRSRLEFGSVLAKRTVWLIGSPRTGSTWLTALLRHHGQIRAIEEPLLGAHLGLRASAVVGEVAQSSGSQPRAVDFFGDRDDYFFSTRYREAWLAPLRHLVDARLGAQFEQLRGDVDRDFLLVKEPHGSEAADFLLDAMPGSRLLIVVRDGRDVVDSMLAAVQPGAWAAGLAELPAGSDARRRFIVEAAQLWQLRTRTCLAAAASLPADRSMIVKYEDLLADTATKVSVILDWVGLTPPTDLVATIETLAFGSASADTGPGRFNRAATPGLWRANFDAAERQELTETMAPMLAELGYDPHDEPDDI